MMMNREKLFEILTETTVALRKGEPVDEHYTGSGVRVTEIFMMPHESEARPDLEKVDVELLIIGVDKAKAEQRRADLITLLNAYPDPDRLAGGPSYIEVGGVIGSQEAAFQLFALGKVLHLWDLITPHVLGVTGAEAKSMAGQGMIMVTGFRKDDAHGG